MQSTAPTAPTLGTVLGGKYRIERVIGEGGMGAVYEAVHTRLGQRVAIKMLLPELVAVPELVGRFEREAKAAARLRHRNSARVIDVDVTEAGVPYMVMELLVGHDLEAELAKGLLPIGEAVHYVMQACAAMSEAHQLGIVHRDLKPSNLFLSAEADGHVVVKVLDFGISKVQSDDVRVTATQTQMGTPLYMSPEQVRSAKNVDHRTDIWSLGVILYELVTGAPPYQGSAAGIGAAIVSDAPPPIAARRPDAPLGLIAVINRAMSKQPEDRFQTTQDLAQALAPYSSVPLPADAMAMSASRPSLPRAQSSSPSIVHADTVIAPRASATSGSWASRPATGSAAPRARRTWLWVATGAVVTLAVGAGAILTATRSPPVAASASAEPPKPLAAPVSDATDAGAPTAPSTAVVTPQPTATATTTTTTAKTAAVKPPIGAHPTATTAPSTKPTATHTQPLANPDKL